MEVFAVEWVELLAKLEPGDVVVIVSEDGSTYDEADMTSKRYEVPTELEYE